MYIYIMAFFSGSTADRTITPPCPREMEPHMDTPQMDTPRPSASSRKRRGGSCCSSPSVRQHERRQRAGLGLEVGLEGGAAADAPGSALDVEAVPSGAAAASDEDESYHTADEDFEDADPRCATS